MLIYLPVAWETAQRNPARHHRQEHGLDSGALGFFVWRTRAARVWQVGGFFCFCGVRFWVWIDASVNDAPWMDAVSATVPKRRLATRSCFSPCCRSAGSYGKVTRRQRIKPPPPSTRRHSIINLGVFKGHQYNKWGYNPTLRSPWGLWTTGGWVLYRCGALSYWVKQSWNCQDARFSLRHILVTFTHEAVTLDLWELVLLFW